MAGALARTESELALVATCADNAEASMARAVLQANGIPCTVQGEQHRSMMGPLGAYIELRVLVPRSALEQAREVLEGARAEVAATLDAEALAAGDAPVVVLNDGSELPGDWRAQRRRTLGWVVMGIVFGPPALVTLLQRCG